MKFYQGLIILLGITLISLKIFSDKGSNIDALVVLIYFMLYIPIVGKYLESAKFLGSEFKFKKEIKEAKKIVEDSNKKTTELKESNINKANSKNSTRYETFDLTTAKAILNTDHILALASIRIEIESKLHSLNKFLFGEDIYLPLNHLIEKFEGSFFHIEQVKALKKIISICNKGIHGRDISYDDAKEIINLTEELNVSFPIGYSINVLPNPDFKENGFICEFEHCIEMMPLPIDQDKDDACPEFGHFCPGGEAYVRKCKLKFNKQKESASHTIS